MTNIRSNTISGDEVLIKLSDLETARINWSEGAYKKSNDELYGILDRCLTLFQDIKAMKKGKRKVIKAIDEILLSRGQIVQKNTGLVTRIVRYVFGICGKREFVYARVILAADAQMKPNQSLHAFITDAGGIEEVSKKKDGAPSPKEQREKLIEAAAERLEDAAPLFAGITLCDELQPDNDNGQELMAVLMRKEPDGTGSIVYRSTNETIINTLLAASERDAKAKKKDADDAAAPGKAADERADVIAEAVA